MDTLKVERVEHVAWVTLTSRTFVPKLFTELGETFRSLAREPELRAVVILSDQKGFSFGLDLPAAFGEFGHLFGGGLAAERQQLLALIRQWQDDLDAVARCPVPVIAAIHGWCIGAGLDLAAACDLRLASADARLSLRETKVAIVADLGSLQRLAGIVGRGHLAELAFRGHDVDAPRAHAMGLVNEVFADRDALVAGARALAAEIAGNAPLVVRGVKEMLRAGDGHAVADGLRYVSAWNSAFLASEDLGEALQAFLEKRAPDYKGR